MPDYPRMPRDFDYSLPDARARWISEAYGIPLEHVIADLIGQDGQVDGGAVYVTNRMFLASTLHYRQRFPERCVNGLDPVRWALHPHNPDYNKCHVARHSDSEYWEYLRTTLDWYERGGVMTKKQFRAARAKETAQD